MFLFTIICESHIYDGGLFVCDWVQVVLLNIKLMSSVRDGKIIEAEFSSKS